MRRNFFASERQTEGSVDHSYPSFNRNNSTNQDLAVFATNRRRGKNKEFCTLSARASHRPESPVCQNFFFVNFASFVVKNYLALGF